MPEKLPLAPSQTIAANEEITEEVREEAVQEIIQEIVQQVVLHERRCGTRSWRLCGGFGMS